MTGGGAFPPQPLARYARSGMRWPPFPPLPWLRSLAVGALLSATLEGAASILGGAPLTTLGALGAFAIALAVAEGVGSWRPRHPLSARALSVLALGPALVLLGADPLLGAVGALAEALAIGIGQVHGLLFLGATLLLAVGLLGAPAGGLGWAALGLALGSALPPALTAALAGCVLGLSAAPLAPPTPAARAHARTGLLLQRAVSVLVLTAAGVSGLTALRGALDPTPRATLVALVAALLAAAVAARLRPRSPGVSLTLACAATTVVWLGLGIAPAALDALAGRALGSEPQVASLLLLAPLGAVGALSGASVGASWGELRWREGGLALALGGLLGVFLLDWGGLALPAVTALLALSLLVVGPSRGAQLAGVVLGGVCFGLVGWAPEPRAELLVAGRYAHLQGPDALRRDREIRARQRAAWSGWSAGVAIGVRAPEETWSARESSAPTSREVHVELDGLVGEAPSRAAAAESLAGLLGALLPERVDRALILGDESGYAHRALVPLAATTINAVAAPRALRAVALLDDRAERAWLHPGALLEPAHPALALRLAGLQDVIIDIARAPWADGARAALNGARVEAAARRLGSGGVYVLAVHLGRLPAGGAEAATRLVLDRFAHVQLWVPPAGADTLIVVGTRDPLPLGTLLARAERQRDALGAFGLETPIDLAGLAIADAASARAWVEEARPVALDGGLSAANFLPLQQQLASLAGHTATPERIWASPEPAQQEALRVRIRAREAFLEVLGEAAAGDLEAVFERTRLLLSEAGEAGSATLDPLLEPHLERGREALARASQEGLTSPAWDEARAAAVTAQMLNPTSPLPRELLGDIALAQGNSRLAREQYEAALAAEPDRPASLTGLARAWRLQGETAQAEEALRKAVRAAPRNASVWQNLGVFLLETGRASEAEEHLRRAASLDDEAAAPHLALAELALSKGDATRALVEVERALRLENTGYGWYLRGRAHFALEQRDLAEEDFRNAVLAEPRLAEARGAIGHIQALRGDLPAAAESFKAVLLLQPENSAARENLKRVTELMARTRPAEK